MAPAQEDVAATSDATDAVEAARLDAARLQPVTELAPVPTQQTDVAQPAPTDEPTQPAPTDEPVVFAATQLFPQAIATPDVAGVQTASITSDRTAITVQVVPPLQHVVQAVSAVMPSTGGPPVAALAVGLVGLGALGIALRRVGRERARRA